MLRTSLLLLSASAASARVASPSAAAAVAAAAGTPRSPWSLAALPPVGSVVGFEPVTLPAFGLRHCDYVASVCPIEGGNDDFRFKIVAALSGAPAPSYSLQSTNFVEMYLAPIVGGQQVLHDLLGVSALLHAL